MTKLVKEAFHIEGWTELLVLNIPASVENLSELEPELDVKEKFEPWI
jgi:hypothetical protein